MSRVRRREGDIVEIGLGTDAFVYAQVQAEPLMGFFDRLYRTRVGDIGEIFDVPLAFRIWVMNKPITSGVWRVVGKLPVQSGPDLLFFKQDLSSGALAVKRTGDAEFLPATRAQCTGLEKAAVWSENHVVDRLQDHFAGRPNKWVESMRMW